MNTNAIIGTRAKKAADKIRLAAKASEPSEHFGRSYDDLFEDGFGSEIYIELARMCRGDEDLMKAAHSVDRWVGVNQMMAALDEYESKHPTLF